MYTANDARNFDQSDLDERIKRAVEENRKYGQTATIRVYLEDPFIHNIKQELEKRGFTNVQVPHIVLKGDVSFSWEDK